MTFFITFLRALATCLITNAHYTGVYPTDLIANGGLIGDIIFFAVSGYCLYSVRGNFAKWYGKRLWRCYLPVLLMTAIFMLLGFYTMEAHNAVWWYVYPTYYHFVASIVVLYIPYYVIMKLPVLKKHIPWIMLGVGAAALVIYLFFYEKSYYHIDVVREPFIRLLFMESMLLGAYFKQNEQKYKNNFAWWMPVGLAVCFVLYFASKLLFASRVSLAPYQLLNQIIIFALLYFVLLTFAGLDGKLEALPSPIKRIVSFLAAMTLEIYVVQYVIIDLLRKVLPFPLNWVILTAAILAAAFALHTVCGLIIKGVDKLIALLARKLAKKENVS